MNKFDNNDNIDYNNNNNNNSKKKIIIYHIRILLKQMKKQTVRRYTILKHVFQNKLHLLKA